MGNTILKTLNAGFVVLQDDLKLHLFTCEIYCCLKCDEVNKSLSEIRKHALKNHTEFIEMIQLVKHIKKSTDHFKEVSVKH